MSYHGGSSSSSSLRRASQIRRRRVITPIIQPRPIAVPLTPDPLVAEAEVPVVEMQNSIVYEPQVAPTIIPVASEAGEIKIITVIDGIPLYTKIQAALNWGKARGITGYHKHTFGKQVGYMAGDTHSQYTMTPADADVNEALKTYVIRDFAIDPGSVKFSGGSKKYQIIADTGAKFKLEVDDGSGNYYDFISKVFSSTRRSLTKVVYNSYYNGSVIFPKAQKAAGSYTFTLTALDDSFSKTSFLPRQEVINEDKTVNLLESVGSNGNTLVKEVYQSSISVNISSMAPTLADSSEAWNGATHSTDNIGVNLGRRDYVKSSFKITITAATNQAIKIDRQPTANDIFVTTTEAIGAASDIDIISDEDIWSETARSTGKVVDGNFSGGATNITMDDDIGALWKIGDRVTGNAALDAKTGSNAVTITHVNVGSNAKVFTISESMAINDNETLNFTEPHYFRWPVTNAIDLYPGTEIDANNAAAETSSYIASYQTSTTVFNQKTQDREVTERFTSVEKAYAPATQLVEEFTASAFGRITAQKGNIVFNKKQPKAFESQNVRFFNYGQGKIAQFLKNKVSITNLKAEIEEANIIKTTINDASATGLASLNDFDVASKNGIMDDVSVVSGVNLTASGGNPTVTTIASSTGKNLTVTPGGHFLQNGQTLTFTGAASVITLTGDIEISDTGDNAIAMFFDVEKFLTCAYNT